MDWSSRPERITRLKEKTHFDLVIMPLAYTASALGFLILAWQGLELMENNPTQEAFWVPGAFFFLLPLPLILFRRIRKHHHRRLKA